jgi:AraC-like DNA-binding protein
MTVSFSTAAVEPRSQLSYWREVVCATFVGLDVEPSEQRTPGFRGEVRAHGLGAMQVATVTSQPHAVVRSPARIRSSPDDDIFVNLAVRGAAVMAQDGREAVLRPGDFTYYDSARPCRIACPGPFRLVVLKIPRDLFTVRCRPGTGATAVAIRGDRGVGALFSTLLRRVPAGTKGLPADVTEKVADSVLDLLTTALSEQATGNRAVLPQAAQLLRARCYITDHLRDPALSPSAVAQALGVSVRYLHALFQAEGTSPFRWMMEQRLDLAARQLADPRLAERSVTSIGFGVGFKDTSHFSRVFKDRYGLGPRGYRQQEVMTMATGPRTDRPSSRLQRGGEQ